MPKQIFAIVGYTDWGRFNTLYKQFKIQRFFPLRSPIKAPIFGECSFNVINASNEDKTTKEYLDRLKKVLKKHRNDAATFVITISLIFDGGTYDVKAVLKYLNKLRALCELYGSGKKLVYGKKFVSYRCAINERLCPH